MRCRGIKPTFFTNEELSEIPMEARLLFIGLWCLADKRGRLEDRPKRIKVEIFPYDDVDCDNLLGYLDQYGFIKRYSVGGDKYIQVINFEKHQHPHHTEKDSVIPCFNGEITVMARDVPRDDPSVICNLLTDNCYLDPVIPPIVPQRGRRKKSQSDPSLSNEVDEVFDAWNAMAKSGTPKLPLAWKSTDKYVRACKARMEEEEFREQWREAMKAVRKSKWNIGENGSGWKATFEWFLRPGKTTEILGRGAPVGKGDWGCEAGQEAPF